MMDQFGAELREFVRRLNVAEKRTRAAGRTLTAIQQGVRDAWTERSRLGASTPPCVTILSGTITGGQNTALPGSTVQILGHTTGIDYGTFPATDGNFAVGLLLEAADASVDLVATGPGARFTAGSPVLRSITRCSSNALAAVQATPASGYHYISNSGGNGCQHPIKNTLTFDNALLGTDVITWVPGAWSTVCQMIASRTTFSCPSKTVPFNVSFVENPTSGNLPFFQYSGTGLPGSCPQDTVLGVPVVCGGSAFWSDALGGGTSGFTLTRTCPDDSTLFSYRLTWTAPANHVWWPAGTNWIDYYET